MIWGFTSHPIQNKSFRRRSFQLIAELSAEKVNQMQQKQSCIRNKIYYNIKLTQKLKPGLVASYELRPENKMGLFWKE